MFWEVGILVTALAVAISSIDTPIGEGMDATGTLINQTKLLRSLGTEGKVISNTDFLNISMEDLEFHNGNSLEERRGCFPTLSCTRAGGYCIRPKIYCNGTVDTQGCRRGRRCKCCIPDQENVAPLTCPTTQSIHTCPVVTPCPISAIPTTDSPTTTAISTTYIPTTTDIPTAYITTTDTPTTNIPTTLAVTTEGPTRNPNLSWLNVGSDWFVRIPQEMNWLAARSLCQANGLDLYHPKDILAVSTYLDDNFSDQWYSLGARGNGTHVVWFSGDVLTSADPWYLPEQYFNKGTSDCLGFITHSDYATKGNNVLFALSCTDRRSNDVLCG